MYILDSKVLDSEIWLVLYFQNNQNLDLKKYNFSNGARISEHKHPESRGVPCPQLPGCECCLLPEHSFAHFARL